MSSQHASSAISPADLAGKVVLVTGASSGIGAATALALGRAGARVVLAARRLAACQALAASIIADGGEAIALQADVTVEADIAAAVAQTVAHFGRLDGAFNNAGALGPFGPLHEQSNDSYALIADSNLRALFWSLKYEIQAMLANGGGAIVNTASIAGEVGFAGGALYSASKHAVLGLTRSAALEYGRQGIRINAVSPGLIATPMSDTGFGSIAARDAFAATTPAGRAGQPEEVAGAVRYLLSDAAAFINGHSLIIDGAYTAQ